MKRRVAISGGRDTVVDFVQGGVKLTPPPVKIGLKHKDSFGKSENLSKIFFAEILVFDNDYEGKSSSSNGLL